MQTQVSQREELASVLGVLLPVLDIVDTPVESALAPDWCRTRGWVEFLLELSDAELCASERGGFIQLLASHAHAPAELRELGARVDRCTRLPLLGTSELALPAQALQGVGVRKRGQLAALLG